MTEAPPTKIAVLTKEELNKYGYKAVTHPDGYVYFEKGSEVIPQISLKTECDVSHTIKTEPVEIPTETENFLPSDPQNTDFHQTQSTIQSLNSMHNKSETCCLTEESHISNPLSNGTEVVFSGEEDWADLNTTEANNQPPKFILDDCSKLKHAEDIKSFGFSSCPLPSCNFISLSVAAMVRHSAKCNGIPTFHINLCTRCNCWLISSMQRDIHAGKCQGNRFKSVSSASNSTGITTSPSQPLIKQYSKPQLKRKIPSFPATKEIEIIQPGLKHPVGSYLRKRSYTTLHFDIWTKKFEEDKYIPCHFKGCHFIALSVGDMCQHWAYCSGDSSFAKFKCHRCSGVVTSQSLLDIHLASSHPEGQVIGREEEYPCQDDKIAESLELLCDGSVPNENLLSSKRREKVLLNQSNDSSIDHNYSSFGIHESLKRAEELDLIQIYETTFSLKPQINKSQYASISNCPNLLLESVNNVKQTSVLVEFSQTVKNYDSIIDRNENKSEGNISFIESKNDKVQGQFDSNSTSLLENQSTSPISNVPISRDTVITDGRLVTRKSCINDKVSEVLLDVVQNQNILADQHGAVDNFIPIKNNSEVIVSSSANNINMDIENNAHDDSLMNELVSEPVKRKRGRPKKIKPDFKIETDQKMANESSDITEKFNCENKPRGSVINSLNNKSERSENFGEDEVDDLPRRARRRTAVIRLQFSDDSDSDESSENEEKNNDSSSSEEFKNFGNITIPIKRKVGRPSKAEKLNYSKICLTETVRRESQKNMESNDDESEKPCTAEKASNKKHEIIKLDTSGNDVNPVRRRGRPRKSEIIKATEVEETDKKNSQSNDDNDEDYEFPTKNSIEKKVMNSSRKKDQPSSVRSKNDVKCGKCDMVFKKRLWEKHNANSHAGLGWLEDEPPIDQRTLDSQTLLVKLRSAFKFCKSAACELCGIEKRSFLGLHSHITICGKTSEELKEALLTCDVCGKQMQSYCMPSHKKMHEKGTYEPMENIPLPKRRSAIKAISSFQHVLAGEKKGWILYQKGDPMPELNFQLKPIGKSKVPCMRENCKEFKSHHQFAMEHFLECPTIPEKYYQCLECPNFRVTEEEIILHSENKHGEKENHDAMREYDLSTESEEDEEVLAKRIRTQCDDIRVSKAEFMLKAQFAVRENLYVRDSHLLYLKAVQEEMVRQTQKIKLGNYETLNTSHEDWIKVEENDLNQYLPPLNCSLPVRHRIGSEVSEYQKLNIFESLSYDDMNIGFVGGVVQNLSWCPTSLERVGDAHQYLAISVGNHLESSPCVRVNDTTTSLLQIWDCGTINETSNQLNSLRMVLGIAMDFGELWDLTWSPNDAWYDGDANKLARIGLVATACHDGAVRLYSISIPYSERTEKPPIYKVHPVVTLKREDCNINKDDACLRLSWGDDGVLCAGYRSGLVSVWRLHQLTSLHNRKQDKTIILQSSFSFYAHFHAITDIALCPSNNRILATGGADKKIKLWDLMNYLAPMRIETGSAMQAMGWMNNWPVLCYLLEENMVAIDLPPQFSFCKTINLKTLSTINDISFNNWAFLTGVINTAGEFYIRQNIDPFIDNKKKTKFEAVISKVIITSTTGAQKKCEYSSYADIENNKFGITFTDYNLHDSLKNAEKTSEEPSYAKYTGNALKKIVFNPNYRSFHHAALGVQCGFVRVMRLKFLQKSVNQLVSSLENN